MDNVEADLRAFISNQILFSENGFEYDDDASFVRSGIIDSMGTMELVNYVGEAFGIEVAPEDITVENFDSLRALAGYVRQKCGGLQA